MKGLSESVVQLIGKVGIRTLIYSTLAGVCFLIVCQVYNVEPVEPEELTPRDIVRRETQNFVQDADVDNSLAMDNPKLVSRVRDRFIIPPPARIVPRVLTDPWNWDQSKQKQATIVSKILKHMKHGFFVEYGSHYSKNTLNTILFEKHYSWSGLLIEPDYHKFYNLVLMRRKAHLSPTCLSVEKFPQTISDDSQVENESKVQCFPLYTYLLALGKTTIDYLSLDMEDKVLEVLDTIPWNKVYVRTISVDTANDDTRTDSLDTYLEDKGFILSNKTMYLDNQATSLVFYNKHGRKH